ncbi:MAG: hypothetical protein GY694_00815, partial [Gammaproteobacteria bacterium]|nr:hypothetical protein [Gammaproteobacteria bacterium]
MKQYNPPIEDFYFLKIKNMWRYFKGEHFSFQMICCYLFFEYTRPQGIFPIIDFLPWAQLFLMGALAGAIQDKTVVWVSSPVNKLMVAFTLVLFASILTAYFPEISKRDLSHYYSWVVVYFLIIVIVNTRQRFYLFMVIFILCASKIAIGTAKSFIMRGGGFTSWGLSGPPGYFQNSGELAILMLTLFPVTYLLYVFLKDKVSKFEKYLLIAFWVAPILTILGASSRGAQIALAVQLLIMFRGKVFRLKPLIFILAFG